MIVNRSRLLMWLTVVGGIGLLVSVTLMLSSTVSTVIAKTNELDGRRATESVTAAVKASTSILNGLVSDNAVWSDAYDVTTAAELDRTWLYDTWGNVTANGQNYDLVLLLDGQQRLLWGYDRGHEISRIDPLWLGHLQVSQGDHLPIGAVTRVDNRLAFISMQRIVPLSPVEMQAPRPDRYLVFAHFISPDMQASYEGVTGLTGIRLSASGTGPRLALRDFDGHTIGWLGWTPRLSGVEAARVVEPQVIGSLVVNCLLVVLLLGAIAYGLKQLASSEEAARRASITDSLSGLPNRRALTERLDTLLNRSRKLRRVTVGFIDLDGFKDVNDTYGHETGDELIRRIADGFRSLKADNVMLARLGGDEFAFLCAERGGRRAAVDYARRLLDWLAAPILIDEKPIRAGASIGIATADLKAVGISELFRRADVAMYNAKANGKARFLHYSPEFDAERCFRRDMEQDIRAGMANNEFELNYQPIVDAHNGQLSSVEALLRWPRRQAGEIGPDLFIPVAEKSGLIHQLGLIVLRQVCIDWLDHPGLKVSVNVSPAQFRDPQFEAKVRDVLTQTGFPPQRLELELTEGYLIDHPARAREAIASFKAAGISVALDDFGTGYTSIAYLRDYGFDKIKLDKSLAGKIDRDAQAAVLVQGAVFIANGLDMQVTAEGVETEEQAGLLRLAGCRYLQGFHFSYPMRKDDLLADQARRLDATH